MAEQPSTPPVHAGELPLASVIVPLHNCERYVGRCIDSIVAQTYPEWELICIDDGSTDRSLAVAREHAAGHERCRFERQGNQGPGRARNRGLDLAQGKYVLFVDADDFIEPDLLELACAQAEATASDIVVWDVWYFDNNHERLVHPPVGALQLYRFQTQGGDETFTWRDNPDYVFQSFHNWPWNKLFRRDFLLENGLRLQEDILRTEDLMLSCPAFIRAKRMSAIDRRLSNYRVSRQDSAMATKDPHALDFLAAFKALRAFLLQEGVYDAVRRSFVNWAGLGCLANLETLNGCKPFDEVFAVLKERGLAELDLVGHEREYFYDANLFDNLNAVLDGSPEEYLFRRYKAAAAEREEERTLRDFAEMDGAAALAQAREEARRAQEDARFWRECHDALEGAWEHRIGKALCWVPRLVQRKVLEGRQASAGKGGSASSGDGRPAA